MFIFISFLCFCAEEKKIAWTPSNALHYEMVVLKKCEKGRIFKEELSIVPQAYRSPPSFLPRGRTWARGHDEDLPCLLYILIIPVAVSPGGEWLAVGSAADLVLPPRDPPWPSSPCLVLALLPSPRRPIGSLRRPFAVSGI